MQVPQSLIQLIVKVYKYYSGEGKHAQNAGEYAQGAWDFLRNEHDDVADIVAGTFLDSLEKYITEEQKDACIHPAAMGFRPELGYTFSTFYQNILRYKLIDIEREMKRGGRKVRSIEEMEVYINMIHDIFDHSKILLIKPTSKHVYFYKKDLSVLNQQEKNFLALQSQIYCTNKVAANYMNCSPTTVGRIWKRISRKLFPAFERNWESQLPVLAAGGMMNPAVKTDPQSIAEYERAIGLYNSGEAEADYNPGWSIEEAYFAGRDDDRDFNTPDQIGQLPRE